MLGSLTLVEHAQWAADLHDRALTALLETDHDWTQSGDGFVVEGVVMTAGDVLMYLEGAS